jgi:hypothetical protein
MNIAESHFQVMPEARVLVPPKLHQGSQRINVQEGDRIVAENKEWCQAKKCIQWIMDLAAFDFFLRDRITPKKGAQFKKWRRAPAAQMWRNVGKEGLVHHEGEEYCSYQIPRVEMNRSLCIEREDPCHLKQT